MFSIFDGFRLLLDNLVGWIDRFFLWLTWPGVTALGTLLVWRLGGTRAAAVTLGAFATYALSGLWAESMETFALMVVAVGLSLLIGIPLGIAAGRSDRVHRFLSPLLDAAQIVPAFAYLLPVVLFFSIGYAAAVVATMIYAIPPAIRITALGIRAVSRRTPSRRRPRSARPAGSSSARCSCRSHGGCSCWGSTRRSCSRSPWS